MKVYIATDLEGISGVTVWEQTREKGHPLYQEARVLLTREVNAAVAGCLRGGADEVVVLDGHGGGFNLVPEELHPGASYVTGPGRPALAGLDESFDAAIFLGYHAMAGTPDAVLAHTQSSKAGCRYWYNGRESGEIAQHAILCGAAGVPVVMVTGDEAACREARAFLGERVVTVAVKRAFGLTCSQMLAPRRARERIEHAAAEALGRVADIAPYRVELPIRARLQFATQEAAAGRGSLSQRLDDRTFERTIEDPREVLKF
ncbi:MAG: M55 family metallopeptidase [bacterium]